MARLDKKKTKEKQTLKISSLWIGSGFTFFFSFLLGLFFFENLLFWFQTTRHHDHRQERRKKENGCWKNFLLFYHAHLLIFFFFFLGFFLSLGFLFDFVPFWIEHVDSCCFSPTALFLALVFRCLFGNGQHLLVNFLVSISQIIEGCHEISRWWTENQTQKKALVWRFWFISKGRRIPCDFDSYFLFLKLKNWLRIECIEGHPFFNKVLIWPKRKRKRAEKTVVKRGRGRTRYVCVYITIM